MTCRIRFRTGAKVPSRIVVQRVDETFNPVGKTKYLPYPNLKPGEKGWTSFQIVGNTAILLTGEWNGV